jgi:hypothetical protein
MAKRKREALVEREARVAERQREVKWGSAYQPAIKSVREEAPAGSRPIEIPSAMLERKIQALSKGEGYCGVVALYNPKLVDFHEQYRISPFATLHPLSFHPLWKAYVWPPTSGSVGIAERLNIQGKHPAALQSFDDDRPPNWVPLSYIGDFLLYLLTEEGIKVLAWDVKSKVGDHAKPFNREHATRSQEQSAFVRDAIYREYHNELQIEVISVSGDLVPARLGETLIRLSSFASRAVDLGNDLRQTLKDDFQTAMQNCTPPCEVINKYCPTFNERQQAITYYHQLVWRRDLRLDLYQPINLSVPASPEKVDILEIYAEWFRGIK